MDNNGKHPQIHLLLDNGFWPKPPRTSLLKHSRVRESFIEQAKKRMTNNYGSLKRSCSLFELKELIEKYGTEKLEVPKRLTPKEVKTADISKKDKKSVSKTSKKKDKSKVVDLDIVDLERREELMDVDYSSRTDISQKVGHDIKSLIKTPDRLLPKVVLEKLDLSGKKSCRLGEPLENKGSGKKPIKLKLILSPENRVDHAKANRHLKADVGNSSEDEIDSDAPLDTVLKMKALHSAEKEKRRKISGNNKLIEEMIQDRSSKTGLDTTHDKTGAGPCDNETLKTKACDEKTERKERTRKQSESDSKHSSHHHKKHKHEKHKHKSKHSHKSNDDKTNASLKEVHSDKPKADNLESDSIVAVETQDQQAMDQSENKDTSLSDHIQAESEKKNKTPVSGLELLAELSKNETIETNRTRESKKDTASENGNDISCIESVAVANKTALEKSLKSPEQGSESKTHDKKKHKDKRKENDLKTKDKHVSSFTKALDDIVSAKVDEIVAGSKKRKAEENRTDPDRIERKHKTGSPKR